jgi:hypothetical protein
LEDRKPEPWQTNEARPFLMIGDVSVSVLGEGRFHIESPAGDEEVEGFEEARRRARELAGLDWSPAGYWPGDV